MESKGRTYLSGKSLLRYSDSVRCLYLRCLQKSSILKGVNVTGTMRKDLGHQEPDTHCMLEARKAAQKA